MAKVPEKIGKYKILSILGSGGSSIVYLGLHPTLKRKVVLKKLNLRGKKSFYDRFVQEAALMMDLNHDHIVKVYDHFKEGSRHYMVMEFVEGASLDQLSGHPLSPETVRYVLVCCCRALGYIHSRNIIHRDIKPSNIFISRKGEVKLGDFGIAKMTVEDETPEAAPIVGTPAYMAPEQFNPRGRITPATDIYALGVSYYELLTGEKLFYAETLEELREDVLKGRRPSLFPLFKNYGPLVWWHIRRSVFRKPFLRYSGGRAMGRALSTFKTNDALCIEELISRIDGKTASGQRGPARKGASLSDVMGMGKKRSWGRLSALLAAGLLVFALAASLQTGLFYRLFLADSYGAFVIDQDVSGEGIFPLDSVQLYRENGNHGKALKPGSLKEPRVFYRKSGSYTLEVRRGNRVEWKSFYLPPLAVRNEIRILTLESPPLISEPVSLRLNVKDGLTGVPLEGEERLYIRDPHGGWVPFSDGIVLFSGEEYSFKLSVPGYYEKEFTKALEFYENELFIHAELIPLPGKLVILHNLDQLSLKINGKRSLLSSGEDKLHFGSLDIDGEEWLLDPGVYRISWKGNGWKQDQKLTVRSGEIVVYRIIPGAGDDKLPVFEMDRRPLAP
ncbi:MAG: serine/threonine-protein kinase [Spirochaetales bacterium]|nr:serine/threonine-protein kinase [Spirochaetales bacterium]